MPPAKRDPKKIKNFPRDPAARIRVCNGHTYVVHYEYLQEPGGRTRLRTIMLGKIIGRRYYTAAEYRLKFTGSGKPRIPAARSVRPCVRRKRSTPAAYHWKRRSDLPAPESIENFPLDNPRARIVVLKDKAGREKMYVCASTYVRYDGRGHEKRVYLGVIRNGRFYAMGEYKRLFGRAGRRKSAAGILPAASVRPEGTQYWPQGSGDPGGSAPGSTNT